MKLLAFIPALMASWTPSLMDIWRMAGQVADGIVTYALDPLTWLAIWAWVVQIMMMLFKFLK